MEDTVAAQTPDYLPGDTAKELQRLTDQHAVFLDNMPSLITAPVDLTQPHLRILDSGCADGLWLRTISNALRAPYELVGADVTEAFFPKPPHPTDTKFIHQSIRDRWPEHLHNHFHLVHQRTVLASVARTTTPAAAIHHLVETIAPGGWIQLVEMDLRDSSYAECGPATRDMVAALRALMDAAGVTHNFAPELKVYLQNEGLVDVREQSVVLKAGKSQMRSAEARERAAKVWAQNADAVVSAAKMFDAAVDPRTIDRLRERLEAEIETECGCLKLLVVIGRKPAASA